jgi:GTP-binding protein
MDISEPTFRDETQILVTAGNGGDGCISFYREKFVTHGGPDGGDGGKGGSVVLRADPHENSLFRIARMSQIAAQHGEGGGAKNCFGKAGEDAIVIVPVGTQIFDAEHGNLLADMTLAGQEIVVAAGGRGGKGNARFASSTQQTPIRAQEGQAGEVRRLRLELKLMADIGIVGLPNAGKSTLLRKLTSARPRVGAYPFTTLHPSLGVMLARGHGSSLVLADIPGLIEGAADGKGLGLRFLRHVERTRLLLHLVDCSSAAEDPAQAYTVVREEIGSYAPELARRPVLVAATKIEDEEAEARAGELEAALAQLPNPPPVMRISAATGLGIPELRDRLFALAAAPSPR